MPQQCRPRLVVVAFSLGMSPREVTRGQAFFIAIHWQRFEPNLEFSFMSLVGHVKRIGLLEKLAIDDLFQCSSHQSM
jgi:hypothetical protein